jgi:predicted aspartyl protease
VKFSYASREVPLIMVDVLFNGIKAKCVIDTGATGCVASEELAAKAGLEKLEKFEAHGLSSTVSARIARTKRIKIANHEVKNVRTVVMRLDHLNEKMSRTIDGIIGHNFLRAFVLKIDFKKKELFLVKHKK